MKSLGITEIDLTDVVCEAADKSVFGPTLRSLVDGGVRIIKRVEARVIDNDNGTLSVRLVDHKG